MVGQLGPVRVQPAQSVVPPEEVHRETPPGPIAPRFVYAGIGLRFMAFLVDSFIIGAVFAVIATAYGNRFMVLPQMNPPPRLIMPELTAPGWMLITGLTWLYYAFFESSAWQATPGKRLLGLFVTDLNMQRLSFWRACLRSLARFVSYFTLYVGFIVAGFTPRKQALHDLLTACLVLRRPRRT